MLETVAGFEVRLDGTGSLQTSQITTLDRTYLNLAHGDYDFGGVTSATNNVVELNYSNIDLSNLSEMIGGSFRVRGKQSLDLSHLTKIDRVSLYANDGATIDLSGVTSFDFAATGNNQTLEWISRGTGSSINLSGVASIVGGTYYGSRLSIASYAGGSIDLRSTTEILDGADGDFRERSIDVISRDLDSLVDLRSLTTIFDGQTSGNVGNYSEFIAERGGQIRMESLRSLAGTRLVIEGRRDFEFENVTTMDRSEVVVTGANVSFPILQTATATGFVGNDAEIRLPQLQTLTGGRVDLMSGASADLNALQSIDGTSLTVAADIQLTLPLVTSYAHAGTQNFLTRQIIASGPNSRISLPNLTGSHRGHLL